MIHSFIPLYAEFWREMSYVISYIFTKFGRKYC